MPKLKEEAQNYEPPKTLTIADLDSVSIEQEILDGGGTSKEGKAFKYKYMLIAGIEYRVPGSVLEQIQTILELKPNLKMIKVTKKGEGMTSKYTVIQMDEVNSPTPEELSDSSN